MGQFKIIRKGISWNISALGYVDRLIILTEVLKFVKRKAEPIYTLEMLFEKK
jgi:hypothetical protein